MTTHANGRFYLTRDNRQNWYIVPTARAREWGEWLRSRDATLPAFATPVGGSPSLVTFADPEVA